MMRWTNDRRHYLRAHHPEVHTTRVTRDDVLGLVAVPLLVGVAFAVCAVVAK